MLSKDKYNIIGDTISQMTMQEEKLYHRPLFLLAPEVIKEIAKRAEVTEIDVHKYYLKLINED